ncbi:NAD-glutamate dehydrogenase [Jeongeupia naejangsanensis]|uniref:NAD-glutamate dehydrogenase n=1 Tax=Jeongeupia naejangsanensis TaxID=613195 RepID=A0ABS2BHG6_9NEIS|nr:NAD-glutamate dehydrogenase [Jeongeupia naejangsanensis]MBM3114381.1 NAD-glutamate dehydrogenase [Jeongeupia naejangsanensis]
MTFSVPRSQLDALAQAREPLADNIRSLFARYYADLPAEDFDAREADNWAGAALSHWRFGARRAPGEVLIRTENPTLIEHGWECKHTVVELVVDDMPFLVDTVSMAINRLGYGVHLVVHPILRVARNAAGQAEGLDDAGVHESWMHFEIDRVTRPEALAALAEEIRSALAVLSVAVTDWPKMTERLGETLAELRNAPPPLATAEIAETIAYLEWLRDDHFIFLGCRDYRIDDAQGDGNMWITPGSGLGMLRDDGVGGPSRTWASLTPELRKIAYRPDTLLILTKADTRSVIHRPTYLDMVCLKQIDASGKVVGELRLLGLYTASAYNTPPRQIPILREKIARAAQQSGADLTGHRGKGLLHVLDTYPREELIETDADELARISAGIVGLQERNRTRVFFRDDIYGRYVSAMLYVPRDNYTTEVRVKVQQLLLERLAGESVEFNVLLSDSPLARVNFITRIPHGTHPKYDAQEIEAEIAEIAQRWPDELRRQLVAHGGEEQGAVRYQRYANAFSAAYCADYPARVAVHDVDALEAALETGQLTTTIVPGSQSDTRQWRLKLYRNTAIELSDCLPLLENLGARVLDERPYKLGFADGSAAWIIDIGIQIPQAGELEDPAARARLLEAFEAIFVGHCENDSFNRLILQAGLAWRDVLVLRAYARYLKQIGLRFSQETLADTLLRFPVQAAQLVELFDGRLKPGANVTGVEALSAALAQFAADQPNLDDEKMLSQFRAAIEATVRTNFWQQDAFGNAKPYVSFKIASAQIPGMPQPVPLFEIFVYSSEMEGVHLRGGKVARGGLRWSDRREDFRTEVLGLVKAQMVKNTVIVPVGSKGGFVVKNPPAEREAFLAKGVECYQTLIRGMLDLTDNLVNGKVMPPAQVTRRDEDDPYLVVAADKGTATFSDIANALSQEYGFWLDDAFASGGSVGYDHKKMGITARGAWVSVERHFREMGIDVAVDPITIAGIGDMSGDVFGNGLLRSTSVKLVAAFDHRHIFIDPNPDPALSYKERERLFALPRSSWADYDARLVSQGGGLWPRSAKSIPLSAEMKALLQVEEDELEPNLLIQAILKAPIDLLYNGGIGTYVKASTQTHAEANDRGSDAVRVDGRELHCKVVGEGGNLGFTQLGRIEYGLSGGRIFTDAIDNSAGVDCSDHEVNIKIFLNRIVASGDMTLKQRNQLLAEMTDEVGHLVLEDNRLQTQAISLERMQAPSLLSVHQRFMLAMERQGKLSRRLEYLPGDTLLLERQQAKLGLTRPELSVLLAYAKIVLKQQLLASTLPDDARWNAPLQDYFPTALVQRYGDRIPEHPLRREIVATLLTNHVVNRYGITCVFRLAEEVERPADVVVAALIDAQQLLSIDKLVASIEAASAVPVAEQYELLMSARRQTERVARWLLQHPLDTASHEHLRTCAELCLPRLPEWLIGSADAQARRESWVEAGVPGELAGQVLAIEHAMPFIELARSASDTGTLAERMKLFLALGQVLSLDWLATAIEKLPRENRWQTLARLAARDDLQRLHAMLTDRVWQRPQADADAKLATWQEDVAEQLAQWLRMLDELRESQPDLAMISAALREMRARLAA